MRIMTKTDFWLGIIILAGGVWAYTQALGFDEASRDYPLFLSAVTALLGAGISGQTVQKVWGESPGKKGEGSIRALFVKTRSPLLIMVLFAVWTCLLSTSFGYLASSVIVLLPVLWLLGIRKPGQFTLITVGIVGAVFSLFFILFEVPLPLNPYVQDFFDLLN